MFMRKKTTNAALKGQFGELFSAYITSGNFELFALDNIQSHTKVHRVRMPTLKVDILSQRQKGPPFIHVH